MTETRRIAECRELVYILFGDLRDLLEEGPSQETERWLKVVLDALLEKVPEEFELRSADGYLTEVLENFPNWEGQVEQLEEEYFSLLRTLRRLRGTIERSEEFDQIAQKASSELMRWMDAFRAHIQAEQRLVMLAANLEVGGDG